MTYQRAERVGKLIQQNLSKIIQAKLQNPRIGLVTITRVKVSKDLSYATIFITGGNDRASKKGLQVLSTARRFIRKRLAGVLRLRKVPEISFKLDKRIEELQRIDELFEKIKTTRSVALSRSPEQSEGANEGSQDSSPSVQNDSS